MKNAPPTGARASRFHSTGGVEVVGETAAAVFAEAARFFAASPHLVILSQTISYDAQPGEECTLTVFVDDPR